MRGAPSPTTEGTNEGNPPSAGFELWATAGAPRTFEKEAEVARRGKSESEEGERLGNRGEGFRRHAASAKRKGGDERRRGFKIEERRQSEGNSTSNYSSAIELPSGSCAHPSPRLGVVRRGPKKNILAVNLLARPKISGHALLWLCSSVLAVWADVDVWVQPLSGLDDVDEHLNVGLLFLPGSEYLNDSVIWLVCNCPVLAAELNDVEGGLYWTLVHSSVMRLRFGLIVEVCCLVEILKPYIPSCTLIPLLPGRFGLLRFSHQKLHGAYAAKVFFFCWFCCRGCIDCVSIPAPTLSVFRFGGGN
ncbi:hypothetical protein Nepgr_021718 [Nepenthes gracilis]|uniref:Uncharacterized protein n=1 Tax=Nepenthes gracilis TaxID=150966 RepID=A0AAD3T0J3_NEPGR|nr:hypothetical protein Nepgr_021718 [Nepenthes gracilis]